jgi:hypothetical protein
VFLIVEGSGMREILDLAKTFDAYGEPFVIADV